MTRALLSCVAFAAFVVASLCLLSVSSVDARSNGLLSSCDLSPVKVGQANWPYGKYGRNFTAGGANSGIMAWAAAPTPSLFYTIRSGDVGARSADPTKYIPGGTLNEIHLRVTDFRRKFIGLVLYATNTSAGTNGANLERRVGSWSFPETYPFLIPTETCGSSVVTHANADLKPIHTRFFFSAPVGTGTVRFRVLIKQAEQNKGYFFWPMVELKLTEGTAPTVATIPAGVNATVLPLVGDGETATVIGGAGLACAEACAIQSPVLPYCHKQAILDINDVASLKTSIAGRAACRTPLVAGCQFAGAAKIDGAGFCSFRSADIASTCPAAFHALNMSDPTTYEPDVCFTKPLADSNNICVCTNNKAAMGNNPAGGAVNGGGGGSGSGLNSAASSVNANGAFVALFAAFAALASSTGSKSSRSLFIALACLVLVLALATPASAHNFIKSQHRANEASVTVPCQQRVGNQPHVQLVAGQWFEAEWAMGHGDSTPGPFYFMILPLSEYNQLKASNITNIMKDYINLAPLSAYRNMSADAVMWEKHHLRLSTESAGDPLSTNVYFKESNLSSTDPSFIWRDDVYAQKLHPSSYTLANKAKWVQRRFTDEIVAKDKRVSYASAKYPWIESVDAFLNPFQEHNPYSGQSAMARFQVPARHGPGDYIAWFYWAGYKDCIDINIMAGTTPVKNRYGLNSTVAAPTVLKLDHCEFTYVNQANTKLRKLGPSLNATQCINDCIARGASGCSSVQVVRATNPPAVTQPYTVNIPFVPQYFNQTLSDLMLPQPCDQLLVHDRATNGCNRRPDANAMPAFMNNVAPDEYVCYGLLPQRNTANQVEEDHTITDEPTEPAFYSTCYQIIPAGGFLNTPPYVYQPPSWNVADACIDCAFQAKLNATHTPDWSKGLRSQDANGGCPDCSIVNAQGSVAALQPKLSGADVTSA